MVQHFVFYLTSIHHQWYMKGWTSSRLRLHDRTPALAKRYGKAVSMRPNWDEIKVRVMCEIVEAKFTQNPNLTNMLLATEDAILIEGNTWGDTFWGVCDGKGENNLGKVLMRVRDRLNTIVQDD